jgi:HSP20 family protein
MLDEFARLQREMDRLWQGSGWQGASSGGLGGRLGAGERLFPPLNVMSTEDRYLVECELPGFTLNDITLTIAGDTLLIKGDKKEKEPEKVSYHRRERRSGAFSRSLTVPEAINAEKTTARFANGILTIEMPKADAARPRQITVQAG